MEVKPFTAFIGAFLVLIAFSAYLTWLSFYLDHETHNALFSESGFFEMASPLGWIMAACVSFCHWQYARIKSVLLGLTFLAFAAREIELHKAYTSDSFLKINFYKDGIEMEQILGGLAAITFIALGLYMIFTVARYILRQRGWAHSSGLIMIWGFGMLFISKILDRAPSILRKDYDITLDIQWDMLMGAFEEGYEFIVPLILAAALIIKPNALRPIPDK